MKQVIRTSCTGKTKELIQYSLETNTPFLALSSLKKTSLIEKGYYYFEKAPQVITIDELRYYNGPIIIDDADQVLEQLLRLYESNVNLVAYSITTDK